MKKQVAILTGGESSERAVALASAKVITNLLKVNYDVSVFDFPADRASFFAAYKKFDVAIPVFHGQGGEDGAIQGFLKTLGVPFIFSDVEAHAISLNKIQTKRVVSCCGVTTPDFRTVRKNEQATYEYPCVIKPLNGGSSIGISIAKSESDFARGLEMAFRHSDQILIEKYIMGDEYTVAIIEEEGQCVALPVIQIRSQNTFFDFESKYDPSLVEEVCPAPIDDVLRNELQRIAISVHATLGVRHISRSDFIVDAAGTPWFLEINTIPGQTLQSLVPKAVRASGRDFSIVLMGWIENVTKVSVSSSQKVLLEN